MTQNIQEENMMQVMMEMTLAVIIRVALILGGIFLISAAIFSLFLTKDELFSFIIAYLSSSIVVLASFKNYQDMVNKRLSLSGNANEFEQRDTIDKLEDPYSLYDEDDEPKENLDLKEAIKKEKELMKQNRRPISEVAKDASKAFSFIRIFAYALLVFGFFYLLNNNLLNLKYYLPTLIIPNIIAVSFLLYKK